MNDAERIRELEQHNAQLQKQLVQAQKLTALGELLSTTTHEFNNVLTTIINYAKIGIRRRDDESRDKAFQKVLTASERAARITHSVLGMARNRGDRFESTVLADLVRESLILLEREMSKYRISVECNLAEVPEVYANANQIQQVLLNLMINARQAMPRGGTLMIGLSHDPKGDLVEMTVRDTGVGIPQEQLPKIFDSFFSTKDGPDESGKGGTGLGLAACRNIIDQHQGRIRVESSVGKGTAFRIRLPLAKTSAPPKPSLANQLPHSAPSVATR